MYIYDNSRAVKSITDLSVGDLFFFSHEKTVEAVPTLYNKIKSKWIVISIIEDKKISLRKEHGKQIIVLASYKLSKGYIDVDLENKRNVRLYLFFKKRYTILAYLKHILKKFKKWVSSE